ncbi:MAG: chromosome segregation protein SMC [Anaerolineales bacterium]|nr:chromosome segregation protein SMC [Anaerolineales bacterium]
MPFLLKSLELQGYKTFANRTLFEFSGTVTAIVGPNGSGKSNIADSLRWVLGEQSYSLLRAKKTEDMIFSGSDSRPRAGMASATITFDNSDGWLPIDFSEVAITRRAYRDGDNEYLVNGQRVRLKDVSELLAQSGLAERTYTVIGQGLVDAALSLRADERRRLFEEAAGIGLHRSRREEALRRLDATRRNLERVLDILAELQPRLASLERQARRAREYEQVKVDLQVLLRDWYGYHWHRLQRELGQAREATRLQENRLETTRQAHTALEEKLVRVRERIQTLRMDLNGWHRQLAQLHNQREELSRSLAVSDEREHSLISQQDNLQAEWLNQQREAALRQEQLEIVGQEVQGLQADLQDAQQQNTAAKAALNERQSERGKAEERLRLSRQQVSGLNARLGQLQARHSERQLQLDRSREALATTGQALIQVQNELKAAEGQLAAAQKREAMAQQGSQNAEEALARHRQQLASKEQAHRKLLDERGAISAELARLKAHLSVLEQAEAALTGYAQGTQILLAAARQGDISGILGALSASLEVPTELEPAISAALGEYLDAVLLKDDPEEALALLEKQTGKGVVLPVEQIKAHPVLALGKTDETVLGVASTLIDCKTELRPVIDLLLGQVIVVRDRQAAVKALKGRKWPVRAVTLRGEVFHASGPIHTSGEGQKPGDMSLLGRARLQREESLSMHQVEEKFQRVGSQVLQLEEELKAIQIDGERLEAEFQQARRQWEASVTAAHQARVNLEAATRQVSWQKDQQVSLQAEITRQEKELTAVTEQLSEAENQLDGAREAMRAHNAELEQLSLDELQQQVAHWDTRSAVAEQALADARTRVLERQASLDGLVQTQQAVQRRIEELRVSVEKLRSDREAYRQLEADLAGRIQALQERIDPAEGELDKSEGEHDDLLKEEAAARQSLSNAEHFYAQTRIAQDRRQEALQALRGRIEEDFGLVAFDYAEQVSGPTPLPLEGMVEQLPHVRQLSPELEDAIKRQRAQLRRMGAINPEAQAEYQEVKQRYEFLTEQVADLRQAEEDVRQVIAELDNLMEREFRKTFQAVAAEFREIFTRLFDGGSARLILTEPENMTATGIDIEARLPGRRTQGLALLSGGERSLTATALIFALLRVSPTPFCVLDEVDAMLDEANVGRFSELLRELSQNTQFVIVTHNRNTVQAAEVIYGVTMGRDSVSQVLSLKLDEISKVVE